MKETAEPEVVEYAKPSLAEDRLLTLRLGACCVVRRGVVEKDFSGVRYANLELSHSIGFSTQPSIFRWTPSIRSELMTWSLEAPHKLEAYDFLKWEQYHLHKSRSGTKLVIRLATLVASKMSGHENNHQTTSNFLEMAS